MAARRDAEPSGVSSRKRTRGRGGFVEAAHSHPRQRTRAQGQQQAVAVGGEEHTRCTGKRRGRRGVGAQRRGEAREGRSEELHRR